MTFSFPPVQAIPYPWPYDKKWSTSDTIVLSIDYQDDLCSPEGALAQKGLEFKNVGAALAAAERLLDWARKTGIPIVHTRRVFDINLRNLFPTQQIWSAKIGLPIGETGLKGRYLVSGQPGSETVEQLAPTGAEPTVDRPANNPFLYSDLHNLLLKMGTRNLIICGCPLEGAVHTAVCAANDRGYEVFLAVDACPSLGEATMETVVRTTTLGGGLFGTVGNVSDLLAATICIHQ